jgi:hypothetical protein
VGGRAYEYGICNLAVGAAFGKLHINFGFDYERVMSPLNSNTYWVIAAICLVVGVIVSSVGAWMGW